MLLRNNLLLLLCMITAVLPAQERPLYAGPIPNARDVPDPEIVDARGEQNRFISLTAVPTLTIIRPDEPNGQAVVICPGGGYRGTAFDKEGLLVAEALQQAGVTSFVLKYRIPQDVTNVDKSLAPLQDAQQALRYVRRNAATYGVDPQRIGIMGFSAGGHLAATAATLFHRMADPNETDTTSVRPDFVALIYPVISLADEDLVHAGSRTNLLGEGPAEALKMWFSPDQQVRPGGPPAFLVHAADDRVVPVGNSLAFYAACVAQDIPAEMHLYPAGGHGFGLNNRTTPDRWIDRLKNWLQTL